MEGQGILHIILRIFVFGKREREKQIHGIEREKKQRREFIEDEVFLTKTARAGDFSDSTSDSTGR